jgi:transposase
MERLFVGVDISKDSFSAAGLDAEGKECFSAFYSMDSDGFCEFLEMVTARCLDHEKVLVAMESTGCYHINLFSFLTSCQGSSYFTPPGIILIHPPGGRVG